MKSTYTSLAFCAALLVCWPALAFAQLVPDPGAPPQPDALPAAQAPAPTPTPTPTPDSQPALPPPGPPPPANLQNLIPTDQLSFLKDYANQPTRNLLKDRRFHNLMKLAISRTEYHYGRDMPLSDAVQTVLDGSALSVLVRDGRFVTVSGSNGPYLRGRGFLWFDLETGVALGAFYFHPTNGEPTPTLTVFSRQLTDNELSMGQLPEPFAEDLEQWAADERVPEVTPRYFIPEDGKKYVLEHDEDYCWSPPGTPAPDPDDCQQMIADAADDDMNAAYFMQETGNAANATAWMLGPDQIAWLAVRDRTCGPRALSCRIRITHERTRVLLGHPGPPRSRR
ncbi:MAG: lysozyme inhibitor LprI family protein [Terracidiphilus sp.]